MNSERTDGAVELGGGLDALEPRMAAIEATVRVVRLVGLPDLEARLDRLEAALTLISGRISGRLSLLEQRVGGVMQNAQGQGLGDLLARIRRLEADSPMRVGGRR